LPVNPGITWKNYFAALWAGFVESETGVQGVLTLTRPNEVRVI
jgi:hypothetical protein